MMRTLDALLEEYLATHTRAPIGELVDWVLSEQARGQLVEADQLWVGRAQRRGLESALDERLRRARWRVPSGASARKFVSALYGADHTWVRLETALADPEQREAVIQHAWSVVGEAAGMIREQRTILLACGLGGPRVDADIRAMIEAAFQAAPGPLQPVSVA